MLLCLHQARSQCASSSPFSDLLARLLTSAPVHPRYPWRRPPRRQRPSLSFLWAWPTPNPGLFRSGGSLNRAARDQFFISQHYS